MAKALAGERIPLKQGLKHLLHHWSLLLKINAGERIPLKQGLKLDMYPCILNVHDCWRADSIKTRIETSRPRPAYACLRLAGERIPLKQGLKHALFQPDALRA